MIAVKNIPALRFPEFEGEWQEKNLDDIASISKGKGISKSDVSPTGELECILYGELYTHYTEVIDKIKSKTSLNPKNLILSRKNDVIIPASGETQIDIATASCVLKDGVAFGGDLNIIRGSANGIFLSYYLNNTRKKDIAQLAQGISVVHLYGSQLKSLILKIPGAKEQQKIASFLTSVDQRIQLLTQKKEKLEHYKKGIMQRIFSQELRFKDESGQDYPEGEEIQFGSLYRFLSTNSLSREKLNYESGPAKNIHYGDIHKKYKSHFVIDNEFVPYINSEVDLRKINFDNYLQEGDLVIADASEDYADIGKCIEICSLNGQPVLAGLHTLQARRKDNNLTIGYGGHMMKSPEIRIQIQRIAQGTKVLSIAANRLSEINIQLPCSSEQNKIATFLSSLDVKIAQVNSQLELTRKWKKGLLQKMFV